MGRDPNPQALLEFYGLKAKLSEDTNDNTNPDDPKVVVNCWEQMRDPRNCDIFDDFVRLAERN